MAGGVAPNHMKTLIERDPSSRLELGKEQYGEEK